MPTLNPISMVERNIRGAWVVYGLLGVKQYYYYTKAEAMRLYRKEYEEKIFTNRKKGVLYK